MDDDFYDEDFLSVYLELLEDYPGAANLAAEGEARAHRPLVKDLLPNLRTSPEGADARQTGEHGLPIPTPYEGEAFSVLDYQSGEYAEADNLDEAIAMRGKKAFFKMVTPQDFEPLPAEVTRLGIAELWAQSTWDAFEAEERNVAEEASANLAPGNVLTLGRIPVELPDSQNWGEIEDLGFGFYHDGEFLPFTPYHDYDQQLFIDAIKTLGHGEWIECAVRSATCNGGDCDPNDEFGFCWRVYSCEVTVYKVRETPKDRCEN